MEMSRGWRPVHRSRAGLAEPEASNLRIVRILLLILLAVLLLPYLVTPFYRTGHPVSTLMAWRWLKGAPVSRQWIDFNAISPYAAALGGGLRGRQILQPSRRRLGRVAATRSTMPRTARSTRGGSTITQQVAKNLFLWPGRSVVRKALELPLAMWIDLVLPKQRILEIYLNIAELGPSGQFGAEAGVDLRLRPSGRDAVAARGGLAGGDPAQSGQAQRPQSRPRGAPSGRDLYGPGQAAALQRCWSENRAFEPIFGHFNRKPA